MHQQFDPKVNLQMPKKGPMTLNLSFYLNFYNIFWELKTFSGTNGSVV
jgi:FtsH-binding integral membrane protein